MTTTATTRNRKPSGYRTAHRKSICPECHYCESDPEHLKHVEPPRQAEAGKHDFSNWRVSYVAPTKPEHSFEPRCHIEADSAQFGSCRVFDVPDPDESQVAAAMAACGALNAHAGLVAALRQFISIYPKNARRHPDVASAIQTAEVVLAKARE